MVAKAKANRKQLFRAALAIAGLTAARWAKEEGGVTPAYLSAVLNGKLPSKRLDAKIDEFTKAHLASTKALVA